MSEPAIKVGQDDDAIDLDALERKAHKEGMIGDPRGHHMLVVNAEVIVKLIARVRAAEDAAGLRRVLELARAMTTQLRTWGRNQERWRVAIADHMLAMNDICEDLAQATEDLDV